MSRASSLARRVLGAALLLPLVACTSTDRAEPQDPEAPASRPTSRPTSRPAAEPLTPESDASAVELGAGPAPGPKPDQPSITLSGRPELPATALLARNGHVADRFTSSGQRVNYPFFADAGELSIFVLDAWGYARAWEAVARVRVLGPAGDVLFERDRQGGATFRDVVFFEAPQGGRFTLVLSAPENHFRYILTRHSNYAPRPGRPEPVGARETVHGYVTGAQDVVGYELRLEPGQEAAVAVGCAEPEGRLAEQAGTGKRSLQRFPSLRMSVLDGTRTLAADTRFALLSAPADGPRVVRLEVAVPEGSPAGLFELLVDRDPHKVRVHGTVVDRFDRPVTEARIAFFREPNDDPMGSTTTGADGTYTFELMPGPYRLDLRAGELQREIRTNVHADRELNPLL